jgi:hypothetical protein
MCPPSQQCAMNSRQAVFFDLKQILRELTTFEVRAFNVYGDRTSCTPTRRGDEVRARALHHG